MRTPIYRNLDRPFRILGLSPTELAVLSLAFVGGGELAQETGLGRIWAIFFTMFAGISLYAFRKSFGDMFARRLFRFLSLPTHLRAQLPKVSGSR